MAPVPQSQCAELPDVILDAAPERPRAGVRLLTSLAARPQKVSSGPIDLPNERLSGAINPLGAGG